ncbi:MAG TPA: putative PEP-binding protein, partial [Candidatus Saccharimonadales bacterium]|nr:putative PEP-binding protein [Candidatus Saccharimonadales bacterium]
QILDDDIVVTVDGSHGDVFQGVAQTRLDWDAGRRERLASKQAEMASVKTRTKVMAILAEPEAAAALAKENVDGIGLLRLEFLLARIGVHPRLYLQEGTEEEFIDQLVQGISAFCQPFGDRPVVLRLTDFKTNELQNLEGGSKFEDPEENPMLGLRGAARYMQQPEVFALEVEAIRRVRETYPNLYAMVPFVRTVAELEWVLNFLAEHGLERGPNFKVWMMAEVPSNVILLDKFIAAGLDGVSIGSNDLTQLILGIDRDNEKLCEVGNELDPAVLWALEDIVTTARSLGATVGICGQAPSDHPRLVQMLVEWGVTSISVSPDRIPHTRELVHAAEQQQ